MRGLINMMEIETKYNHSKIYYIRINKLYIDFNKNKYFKKD